MQVEKKQFFAASAWVQGAWVRDVLLTVDANGLWCGIQPNTSLADRANAKLLTGPVLPGLVNAHSHAFQRAIAGLTERRGISGAAASDDFWSWRDRMYSVAMRITPIQLEHIASMLYAELLTAGYTQVCEFHYLHNSIDGKPYADPLEMSLALVRAAQRVGMGLTMLPTLYMRSGFGAKGLRDDQCRFASTPDSVLKLVEGIQRQVDDFSDINVGVAVHSLRAADKTAVEEVATFAQKKALPVHIHIAEQTQEVEDCISHTGRRPIEWLHEHVSLDSRWNLVHATHTTPDELKAVYNSDASIVICPSTEANLGDGVFDYSGYSTMGGQWSIGSDSHVTRSWTEELRLLEYSQRLTQRKRNVAAQTGKNLSSASVLFEAALGGGRSATAKNLGGIRVGNRADFLILNSQSAALLGIPCEYLLDALVFSSPDAQFINVFVAGNQVLASTKNCGDQLKQESWSQVKQDFEQTMRHLWV
ncbi:MAG: formimidoylglutamate deiminase [Burkholderiaceae bacterium]|nr:formimidoylglutamate deiminase [Burkholderiaceae bacterium]